MTLKHGDLVRAHHGLIVAMVEHWVNPCLLMCRVLRNPSHDGRYAVGGIIVLVRDQVEWVGSYAPQASPDPPTHVRHRRPQPG